MLGIFAVTAAAAANFIYYPGFVHNRAGVEAIMDRGLTVEIIVRCHNGTGIISYSKGDRKYCTPDFRCFKRMRPAVNILCR